MTLTSKSSEVMWIRFRLVLRRVRVNETHSYFHAVVLQGRVHHLLLKKNNKKKKPGEKIELFAYFPKFKISFRCRVFIRTFRVCMLVSI